MPIAPTPSAPPFCPNEACPYHTQATTSWKWVKFGFFTREKPPYRVQRYRCCHCRRHFSDQSFETTYWLKCPELQVPVFHLLVGCMCFRQAARMLDVSPQTIATHSARIGRHCQLFHEWHRPKGAVTEPTVLDTFVTFEYSQYHPTGFHLLAGKESHFLHGFTETELRRSGTMTSFQRKKRARLEAQYGKPDPRSTEKEVANLLHVILKQPQQLTLFSDEHTDYLLAFRHLPHVRFEHRTISSRVARTSQNPLFAINLLDGLIRHSSAGHKRETIAFAKRRQCAAERLWAFLVWRNYCKSFSERKRDASPAMRLGICGRRYSVNEVFSQRFFPGRIPLPERWARYYWRQVPTRMIPGASRHGRMYAA